MAVELIGKYIESLPIRKGTSSKGGEWSVQDFILEVGGQFPKKVCISLWNDKIDALSKFTIGEDIKASIDIESREFNGKWYTNVKAWQIEKLSNQNTAQSLPEIPPHDLTDIPPKEDSDDLPF